MTEAAPSGPALGAKVTVWLIRAALEDLKSACRRERLSKTDVINRGVSLYEFVSKQRAAGRVLLVRDEKTGATQRVHIL